MNLFVWLLEVTDLVLFVLIGLFFYLVQVWESVIPSARGRRGYEPGSSEYNSGKWAVVTGGSRGIGFETALGLARDGVNVVLGVRDVEKGREKAELIRRIIANENSSSKLLSPPSERKSVSIECAYLDLMSLQSAKEFALGVLKTHEKIDILVLNAGVMGSSIPVTRDAFETNFGVNHLGHYLIARLLLKALLKSSDGRVVWVSSVAHRIASFVDWGKFHRPSRAYTACKGWAYSQSKLANILMAHEFQKRYGCVDLCFNVVHPGIVNTGIMRGLPRWMQMLGEKFGGFLFMSAREGAMATIHAALSPQLRGNGGIYFDRCKAIRSSALSYDAVFAQTLFRQSEEWTKGYF